MALISKKYRRLFVRILLMGLIVFVFLASLLIIDGLNDNIEDADVCLILGNTVYPNREPSERLKARLDRAVKLYEDDRVMKFIVSGALGKEGHDEAVVMRDYLVERGIQNSEIIIDSMGFTTFDSAKNTREIMEGNEFKSVIVVTQYFHIPRSRYALKRFGLNSVYTAHADYFELRDLYSIAREILGFVKYIFKIYEK